LSSWTGQNSGIKPARISGTHTCHFATRVRRNVETGRGIDSSSFAQFVDSRFNLQRGAEIGDDPRSQRAFGYLDTKTAFTQRTINESAMVAAALSPR
jgi:hypothetical protein